MGRANHKIYLDFFTVWRVSAPDPQIVQESTVYVSWYGCTAGPHWWLSAQKSAFQCRIHGFNPWAKNSPGEGNAKPLLYSSLGNPMDRGAWWAIVHGVTKELDMT